MFHCQNQPRSPRAAAGVQGELVIGHALHGHRARDQNAGGDGQAHGQFVGDDLRRRAHAAQQRPLVVAGPAGHQDAQHFQAGDRGDVENADVEVRDVQRVGERQDRQPAQRRGHHDVGRERKSGLSAASGMMSSLRISFSPSAMKMRTPGAKPAEDFVERVEERQDRLGQGGHQPGPARPLAERCHCARRCGGTRRRTAPRCTGWGRCGAGCPPQLCRST